MDTTTQQRRDMLDWLRDCALINRNAGPGIATAALSTMVDHHYDGGLAAFLRDGAY